MIEFTSLASGSSGNAYFISDGKTRLLLDAGIPYRAIQTGSGFKMREIAGAFITHCHGDHSKAAKDLGKYGTDVYTSRGTLEACRLSGHRFHAVRALEQMRIGTFDVLPFDVEHDAPEPLGFLFASTETGEKLLYFTDTYFIKYKFTGLSVIACECNFSKAGLQRAVAAGYTAVEMVPRLMRSHMSLEHLEDMLRANDLSRLQQIYLLHLSNNNSDAEEMREAIQMLTGVEVYVC